MLNETDKKMMFKFIERNYPVTRIKHGKRFRRAIIADSGNVYILGEMGSHNRLKFELYETLRQVFVCEDFIINIVLDTFLPNK